MDINLNTLIKERYAKMSPNQKIIATYILQNYDKAAFLTAQQLGETLGVSESTVIRFATFLDYEGYPQLSKALQDLVKNKITTVERLQLSMENSDGDSLQRVLSTDIFNLQRTLEEISPADFKVVVDEILKARHVYIISLRSAQALGKFLYFYLQLLLKNCVLLDESLFFEELKSLGPEDLVIGISFPRYTRMTVEGLKLALEKGAQTVAITDSVASPLARFAKHTLAAHSGMASFVDSFVAPLSLINALIISVGTRDNEKTAKELAQLEEIWDSFKIYYKD